MKNNFLMTRFFNLRLFFLISPHFASIFAQKSILFVIQNISTAVVSNFMT